MPKVSVLGVVVGSVTDIVATAIHNAFLLSGTEVPSRLSHDQYQRLVEQAMLNDWRLLASSFVGGGICSILGGYLAARIARRSELLNGVLASFLCVGSGVYAMDIGSTSFPAWILFVSDLLSAGLALLGGISASGPRMLGRRA
jgi:hypothetical protein